VNNLYKSFLIYGFLIHSIWNEEEQLEQTFIPACSNDRKQVIN